MARGVCHDARHQVSIRLSEGEAPSALARVRFCNRPCRGEGRPVTVFMVAVAARHHRRGVKHFRARALSACHIPSVSEADANARHALTNRHQTRDARKPTESTMKKFAFAALAMLGVVLGTASLITPANASTVYLYPPSTSAG
jgi:hypothetical protein